ncbi:MAG: endonuclease III [Candidatus Carbobacillus altaicus]|uniref:Endonuclease III n=1 Tax=Candidatus Carbonibacillus altaicus TaxID=2163959 RepID=A0A2R6XZX9_9BACL|nr:endonuclease III [Candidatus Carbobacillus altaicus]PTQ55986.1 MAG: Endonuclease III [Candidatus Carbobacillus altaicus]
MKEPTRRPSPKLKKKARIVLERLAELYPDAHCELNHENPFQLLVATILSAQTTDAKVNEVTPALFARFPDAFNLAQSEPEEIQPYIQSIGLYKNKSKHIVATARLLVEKYGGEVPREREALETLPGVGRKTANVVLSTAFGLPALAVDTHVLRVSHRIGLTTADDPLKVEKDLQALFPMSEWGIVHHRLIWHGRRMCSARAPQCAICPIREVCDFAKEQNDARCS